MNKKEETEAKKTWCPFVQITAIGTADSMNYHTCIGSDCMMWRWTDIGKKNGFCGLVGLHE
jgi:hypothetical protein